MLEKRTKKILYFAKGMFPTDEELAEAEALHTKTLRNASLHGEGETLEDCDAVAGSPPDAYLEKYKVVSAPSVSEAVKPHQPPPPGPSNVPAAGGAVPTGAIPPPPWGGKPTP
jgi:hypothetical protein